MTDEPRDDQPSIDRTRLSTSRYLEAMDADVRALADSASDLALDVPGCAGWTVRELLSHVIGVYRHKIAALDLDAAPEAPETGDWGDVSEADDPVVVLLDTYASLRERLVARPESAPTWSWWPAEQTVGFWVRRMAQETAVHRWDGESAAEGASGAGVIDDDLAADGIDELLGWLRWDWGDLVLDGAEGQEVLVTCGDHSWTVALHPARVDVTSGASDTAVALLAADASTLLLHLWGRPVDGVGSSGDQVALGLLRARLAMATD